MNLHRLSSFDSKRDPSPHLPRRRRARWLWLGGVFLFLGVAAAVTYLLVREDPVFPLRRVEVSGHTRLSANEALGLAGLVRGMNLLHVDERRGEASLRALPFVREAVVETKLPQTVRIRIEERRPAMLVALGPIYVADAEGVIYRRLRVGENPAWPVLTGLRREDVRKRRGFVRTRIREAVRLAPLVAGRCVEEFAYHEVRGFSLILCRGPEVRLGHPPFAEKVARLAGALRHSAQARILYLDDAGRADRVVVRNAPGGG